MPRSVDNLRNIIVCDDIRNEVGNKHSLMGIFGGDILVTQLPAQIQIAIFMQYMPSPDDGEGQLIIELELRQDDLLMIEGKIEADIKNQQPATLILPKAVASFDKECTFRLIASVDGGPKQQIMAKKIIKVEGL